VVNAQHGRQYTKQCYVKGYETYVPTHACGLPIEARSGRPKQSCHACKCAEGLWIVEGRCQYVASLVRRCCFGRLLLVVGYRTNLSGEFFFVFFLKANSGRVTPLTTDVPGIVVVDNSTALSSVVDPSLLLLLLLARSSLYKQTIISNRSKGLVRVGIQIRVRLACVTAPLIQSI
jgi:hypothetical protein